MNRASLRLFMRGRACRLSQRCQLMRAASCRFFSVLFATSGKRFMWIKRSILGYGKEATI